MDPKEFLKLNPIVHAPIRLAVLSILISVDNANFSYLKEATGSSDGNLSTHLSKLEASGYIAIEKKFVGKKPQTLCSITSAGKEALLQRIAQLETIIAAQKE